MNLDNVTETEGGFESDAPETNRVQVALVGESEPAQGGKLPFVEIIAIMLENESIVLNADGRGSRLCVVRVLQQFRNNVPRALHLAK